MAYKWDGIILGSKLFQNASQNASPGSSKRKFAFPPDCLSGKGRMPRRRLVSATASRECILLTELEQNYPLQLPLRRESCSRQNQGYTKYVPVSLIRVGWVEGLTNRIVTLLQS